MKRLVIVLCGAVIAGCGVGTELPDADGAGTSENQLGNNGSGPVSDTDPGAPPAGQGETSPGSPLGGEGGVVPPSLACVGLAEEGCRVTRGCTPDYSRTGQYLGCSNPTGL